MHILLYISMLESSFAWFKAAYQAVGRLSVQSRKSALDEVLAECPQTLTQAFTCLWILNKEQHV